MKILISHSEGAGWSTWNHARIKTFLLTYDPIINAIEAGQVVNADHPLLEQLKEDIRKRFGIDRLCLLGANTLQVIKATPPFQIQAIEGAERVRFPGDDNSWIMSEG